MALLHGGLLSRNAAFSAVTRIDSPNQAICFENILKILKYYIKPKKWRKPFIHSWIRWEYPFLKPQKGESANQALMLCG